MPHPPQPVPAAAPRLAPVDAAAEPYGPAGEEAGGARLLDYWRVVRQYKWSILALALVAGVIGGVSALAAVPVYRADVKLLVRYPQPSFASVQQYELNPMYWMYYQTQYDIVRSRAVAERVVDRLGLAAQAPAGDADEGEGPGAALRAQLAQWVALGREWLPPEWRPPAPPPQTPQSRRSAAVERLLNRLTVSGGKDSEIIYVSYESENPGQAAAVANAVADAYIAFGLESRIDSARQQSSWITGRVEELRGKLEESEAALQRFQAQEQMVDSDSREKIIGAKLGSLTAELIKAQARRGEAEARYRRVRKYVEEGGHYEDLVSVLNNPILLDANREVTNLEGRVAELSERYGEKHPKMISARADLREARRRLETEVNKAVETIRKEYEVAAAQEAELSRIIDKQQAEMRSLSGKAFQLAKLEREVEANRKLYDSVLAQSKESNLANQYDVTNVKIVDPAAVPTAPFKPDKKRIVIISLVLGLGLGVVLAFLRDHLDNTFKTRHDVEERLRLPVLGVLQRVRRRRRGGPERHLLHAPRSGFSEAINDIRTALLFAGIDEDTKVILVSSATAGEGKTTLATNLALALRQRGRTLLLDTDLRKGRIGEVLGVDGKRGLSDVVAGQTTLKDAIVPDPEVGNLHVLAAGSVPPNPLEVLSSRRFARIMEQLRSGYDYLVIDGSPLLPVSDAILVGRFADCVVLAVQADRTTYTMAQDAVKRLLAARIRPAGVVLQQVDAQRFRTYSRSYHLYGGYYGYSGYVGQRGR